MTDMTGTQDSFDPPCHVNHVIPTSKTTIKEALANMIAYAVSEHA